jgi:hypothetical protein
MARRAIDDARRTAMKTANFMWIATLSLFACACSGPAEPQGEDDSLPSQDMSSAGGDMSAPEEDMARMSEDMGEPQDMGTPEDMAPLEDMALPIVRTVEEVQFWDELASRNHMTDPNFSNIDREFLPMSWFMLLYDPNSVNYSRKFGRKWMPSAPGGITTATAWFDVEESDGVVRELDGVFQVGGNPITLSVWVGIEQVPLGPPGEVDVGVVSVNRTKSDAVIFGVAAPTAEGPRIIDGIVWREYTTTLHDTTAGVGYLSVASKKKGTYYVNMPRATVAFTGPSLLVDATSTSSQKSSLFSDEQLEARARLISKRRLLPGDTPSNGIRF